MTFGLIDHVPSYNTIDNWVRKCGLDEIKHTPDVLKDIDYAAILDECMMIGSEKLLPVLAVPAEHQGRPLRPEDVKVIGLHVKSSWNAKTVSEVLKADVETVKKSPEYVITDNGSTMHKGVEISGYTWHRDISHTLAMYMERTYKNDVEFVEFYKKMAIGVKQFCMKKVAYLQPPSQRTKARFMNISFSIDWADKMLQLFPKFSEYERKVFSYIPQYASFINEIKEMVSCIQFIETEMKYHGLSKKSISICKRHVITSIMRGNNRMRKVGQEILAYLSKEELLLKDDKVINNSSDIIESFFGTFKYKQSPNKLNGVTALALHLPVILAFNGDYVSENYNIKKRLCRTKIKDINLWKNENLLENLVAKRIRTMKTA